MTFVDHLSRYAPGDWASAVETLAPEIHPIDLSATRVWFAFFPRGPRPEAIESSHRFLYGHRYWPQVKRAILTAAKDASWSAILPELLERLADHATRTTQVDRDQLLGITAASLLTLRYVGLDAFAESAGTVQLPNRAHVRSIRQVRRARERQRWHLFGSMFGKLRFRMTYNEASPDGSFDVIEGGTIASGMPSGMRQCGSTCSGACVIGVLAGAQYLSPIDVDEAARLESSGYAQSMSAEGHPIMRLACYARPGGEVSFVMRPPEEVPR